MPASSIRAATTRISVSSWTAQVTAAALCWIALASSATAAGTPSPVRKFDHLTTGYELTGAHRDAPCESCHVNAVFEGTARECAACHSKGSLVGASAKPADHILSTERCGDCHTTSAFGPASRFDHAEVRGSCESCHNNVRTTGKPPNHLVTNLDCNACHNTTAWQPANFSHAGITGNCVSCHNGVQATGKSATHIQASTSCESCHAVAMWGKSLDSSISPARRRLRLHN